MTRYIISRCGIALPVFLIALVTLSLGGRRAVASFPLRKCTAGCDSGCGAGCGQTESPPAADAQMARPRARLFPVPVRPAFEPQAPLPGGEQMIGPELMAPPAGQLPQHVQAAPARRVSHAEHHVGAPSRGERHARPPRRAPIEHRLDSRPGDLSSRPSRKRPAEFVAWFFTPPEPTDDGAREPAEAEVVERDSAPSERRRRASVVRSRSAAPQATKPVQPALNRTRSSPAKESAAPEIPAQRKQKWRSVQHSRASHRAGSAQEPRVTSVARPSRLAESTGRAKEPLEKEPLELEQSKPQREMAGASGSAVPRLLKRRRATPEASTRVPATADTTRPTRASVKLRPVEEPARPLQADAWSPNRSSGNVLILR